MYSLIAKVGFGVAWFASALYVHRRGRVRHRFGRQLTDHSTLLAPLNALTYHFSKVKNQPYLDLAEFPELEQLRSNWKVIAAEARALFDEGEIRASDKREDIAFNSFFKRGWKRFYFKWYADILPSADQHCPKTAAIVRGVPSLHAAMFAVLPPGGELGAHRDPFAGSLRYHLGLVTPNDDACHITVDGEFYSWRDGEDVLFDETFIHAARNDTDQTRIIFFADVARPVRTRAFAAFTRFICVRLGRLTSSRNTAEERLGWVNRMARPVYAVKSFFTRLKDANVPLYKTCKLILGLYLAYVVFWPNG